MIPLVEMTVKIGTSDSEMTDAKCELVSEWASERLTDALDALQASLRDAQPGFRLVVEVR